MNTYLDYYNTLTEIEKKNSPKELFFKGDFSLLEFGRRVSVVGSRNVSEMGIKRTRFISNFLVDSQITVVSGLAEGVDTTAHLSAIERGGKTIAVIGTPLVQCFPVKNKKLQDQIANEHLLVSQFPENYSVTPKNFPIRNRTMALISDATIIIEASEKSGTKHQGWATDITYIPMRKGFMYLMAVIDLYSRKVLNWSLSNTMSADWCAEVLEETIKNNGCPEIFNTDQGSQFTSDVFINVLKYNEIKISMDGKGRALDNIFIERLWKSVKYEHVYLYVYEDGISLYKGLEKYFTFYNQERLHQSLNYKTPNEIYHQNAA